MIGILLAAGFSRRFGHADKLMQSLSNGQSIAFTSAVNLIKAMPLSVAVVRQENKILSEALTALGFHVVFCSAQYQEMADSLTAAIRFSSNFESQTDGFVIALADMPYIKPSTIKNVADKMIEGAEIVIPTFNGKRGHPVGFSAKYQKELEALKGDEGARSIVNRYANALYLMPTDDSGILADIDTPKDLMR